MTTGVWKIVFHSCYHTAIRLMCLLHTNVSLTISRSLVNVSGTLSFQLRTHVTVIPRNMSLSRIRCNDNCLSVSADR